MQGATRFIDPPTQEEIREIGKENFLNLTKLEIEFIEELIHGYLPAYRRIDRLPQPTQDFEYTERDPGYRPDSEEDPFNAFVRKCCVPGSETGPLSGYEVGLKDNIAVAGVETTMGSPIMDGYVPQRDATVVSRLLNAGATITGKLTTTPFSVGDSFHDPGRNPRNPSRDAGASSTGSAIAVVTGDVDIALGADQGGSIRQPASWCGCVGLKPTWGLVPYTGIQSIEDTVDHVGPMTATVEDCARVLEVIAGYDPRDPRQRWTAPDQEQSYIDTIEEDIDDISIGVLSEGFEDDDGDQAVYETVRAAIDELEELGATVTEVSVPFHTDGALLSTVIMNEGFAMKIDCEGLTPFCPGYYDVNFAESFGKARRVRGDDISLRIKAKIVFGNYLGEHYQHRYYSKAQNLARELTSAYDGVLEDVDILALPTWNEIAPSLSEIESYEAAVAETKGSWTTGYPSTTAQFNVSGHPAMTIPCGTVTDMPVGLQLVSSHYREDQIFKVAHAFEQNLDWQSMT
jgi:amidase